MIKHLIFTAAHVISLSMYAQEQKEAPYIIGGIVGGVGNMFFEVATTCAAAWDHGAEAYFPDFAYIAYRMEGEYEHLFFRCKIFPPHWEITHEWESPHIGYASIPYQPGMKIAGYCQSEKYFAHHRNRLLTLLAPSFQDLSYLKEKYGWIIDHPRTVSLYVRHYSAEKPQEDGFIHHVHSCCGNKPYEDAFIQYDREYFEKAMNLFPDDVLFVVTSDNLAFARENIPTVRHNVVFIENEPPYINILLQSFCKDNIISNSSSSWWGAWLNQNPHKTVIRPKQWFTGYPDMEGPSEWIKVDVQGVHERQKAPKHYVQQSATGNHPPYLAACKRAAEDPSYFMQFRSRSEYADNVECGYAHELALYLHAKTSPEILSKLDLLRKLDQHGHPGKQDTVVGSFSGTTLRYIVVADQITKFFTLPDQPIIAEIGAGFGGQCYVMQHITPFSKYIIYDLPEVEQLIGKMLNTLKVNDVILMPHYDPLKEEKIDLLISNYAFSELDRQTQLDYFTRVIKKADRGYIIFNKTSPLDCLSIDEFVQLLRANHMNPEIHQEPVLTYEGNLLIIWDKTVVR